MISARALGAIAIGALAACGDNSSAGVCSEPPGVGTGTVELTVDGVTPPQTDAYAEFFLGPAINAPSPACTITRADACVVAVCPRQVAAGPDCAAPNAPAGVITFSGGPIAITLGADAVEGDQAAAWSGGETLHVTATGDPGGVPAFHQTVIAPSPFTLTSPSFASPVVIERATPLVIEWSGGESGNIVVTLSHDVPQEATYQVMTCTAPASAGTLTIPPAAYVPMSSGDGEIEITNSMSAQFTAGGFDVEFYAGWDSGSATGGSISIL